MFLPTPPPSPSPTSPPSHIFDDTNITVWFIVIAVICLVLIGLTTRRGDYS